MNTSNGSSNCNPRSVFVTSMDTNQYTIPAIKYNTPQEDHWMLLPCCLLKGGWVTNLTWEVAKLTWNKRNPLSSWLHLQVVSKFLIWAANYWDRNPRRRWYDKRVVHYYSFITLPWKGYLWPLNPSYTLLRLAIIVKHNCVKALADCHLLVSWAFHIEYRAQKQPWLQ